MLKMQYKTFRIVMFFFQQTVFLFSLRINYSIVKKIDFKVGHSLEAIHIIRTESPFSFRIIGNKSWQKSPYNIYWKQCLDYTILSITTRCDFSRDSLFTQKYTSSGVILNQGYQDILVNRTDFDFEQPKFEENLLLSKQPCLFGRPGVFADGI